MADNSDPATFQTQSLSSAEPADSVLVGRTRTGDEDAFEELFNRHRRRVALIASRFFRQREQIEEIIQESFTKAFFALADFSNQQEQSFAAWLARIAFNTCYDELRRRKRRPESSLSEVTEEEAAWLQERLSSGEKDIESAAIERELAAKLLAHLSPEDRYVLVMLDVEGLSVAEIAGLTKWSAAKVKVRAHRARGRLRNLLKRFM
ncbi:MAG TPA: sigma-70 family RNA polymerase sigma factor [Pyrinomonadaceae bacterium]|nr:sigma-70 family RNA polymerase sigma factor [Pyrinomonadaceae bacterium]